MASKKLNNWKLGLSGERHLYHLRMATGILNFIDSGFSTANNYRDSFQRSILFVTTKFFYTNNLYDLGYPEHFIQAKKTDCLRCL